MTSPVRRQLVRSRSRRRAQPPKLSTSRTSAQDAKVSRCKPRHRASAPALTSFVQLERSSV
eukprot:6674591-Prymnesium_polylepis.1